MITQQKHVRPFLFYGERVRRLDDPGGDAPPTSTLFVAAGQLPGHLGQGEQVFQAGAFALASTTVTLVALFVSPITLPRRPSSSRSQPLALAIAAHLAWAKHLKSLWKSEDRSPQGPATSLPSSTLPRALNLDTKGPGCDASWLCPARAPRNLASRSAPVTARGPEVSSSRKVKMVVASPVMAAQAWPNS